MSANSRCFYLGTITPDGFVSLADKPFTENDEGKTYIVKGGRYTAAPKLIEMLSDEIEKEGFCAERMINFLESDKLDGVYFPDINVTILDGNNPNSIEPLFCDCKQYTIGLSDCMDKLSLFENRKQLMQNILKEKEVTEKSIRFLSAAKAIHNDTLRIVGEYADREKTERFVSRLVKREFGSSATNGAKEYFRFLDAVTPDGISVLDLTIKSICPKIYVIEDKIGIVSEMLLENIKTSALVCGFDVINCLSPLKSNGSPEHIIVPGLGLGIFTSDKLHPFKGDSYRKINSSRFTDSDVFRKNKVRINFNTRAESELIEQSAYLLSQAKDIRQKTAGVFDKYTDYKKVCEIKDSIKDEILSCVDIS